MTLLLALYIAILPIQWALSPLPGIDLALSRLCALALIGLWAALSLARRSLILPRPALLLPLVSFLAIASASYFWAENRDWAIRKIIFLWNFFPLLVVFMAAMEQSTARALITRGIVFSGALAGAIGLLQSAAQSIWGVERVFAFWTGTLLPFFLGTGLGGSVAQYPSLLVNISGATVLRASALFPDPHMLSLFLGLALPIAIGYTYSQPKERRPLPLIASSIILIADLLTFSRGGYIGLATGVLTFGALSFSGRVSAETIRRTLIGLAITTVLSLSLLATPIGTRFLSSFSSADGSNNERLRLWQEAISHIADQPLLGTGIGNYPLAIKPSADYREPIYAHSLPLDIAVEIGLLGLAAFLGLLAAACFSAWTKRRDIMARATFISLAIFSAHSCFELPLFSVQVLPLFLAIIALASVRRDDSVRL
jgi:O-antigen ligase